MNTKRKPKPPPKVELSTFEELMTRAEGKYLEIKMGKFPYKAPETFPGIQSDQIKALAFAIADLLDSRRYLYKE